MIIKCFIILLWRGRLDRIIINCNHTGTCYFIFLQIETKIRWRSQKTVVCYILLLMILRFATLDNSKSMLCRRYYYILYLLDCPKGAFIQSCYKSSIIITPKPSRIRLYSYLWFGVVTNHIPYHRPTESFNKAKPLKSVLIAVL